MEDDPIEAETEGEIEAEQYVDTKNIALPQGLVKVKDEAFYNWRKTQTVSIPPSVTKIGNRAFYSCANLSDLVLPKSVEAIGEEAFAHCMSLRAIHIPDGVTRISKGGVFRVHQSKERAPAFSTRGNRGACLFWLHLS